MNGESSRQQRHQTILMCGVVEDRLVIYNVMENK
jgi:hypothetical protein